MMHLKAIAEVLTRNHVPVSGSLARLVAEAEARMATQGPFAQMRSWVN